MMWLIFAGLALLALAPAALFARRGGRLRGRRDAALLLHRAQLGELDRDLSEGRLLPAEHQAARLEVQRRLLAEAALGEASAGQSSPFLLVITSALVIAIAMVLYTVSGTPDYAAKRDEAQRAEQEFERSKITSKDAYLVSRLKEALTKADQPPDQLRRGYMMLGRAELELGNMQESADAFRHGLAIGFDPFIGAETAEMITELNGSVTPEALGLFKRALAEAPKDAPWRASAQKRVDEARK